MKEFLRFADYGGALVSVIEPKALILESLAPHFTGRFPEEQFMIFDKTHGFAPVSYTHLMGGKSQIKTMVMSTSAPMTPIGRSRSVRRPLPFSPP